MSPPATIAPPKRRQSHVGERAESEPSARHAYGQPFWLAYIANALVLTAVALMFRYADFVTLLGGSEFHLGWIVGLGMVGSFFVRLALGSWIDRYGSRPLWIGSLVLFTLTCFAHLTVTSPTGLFIYLLRVSYCCAVAGINGASMTFVSSRVSTERLAELVGMLGTAGFTGAVLGTLLGDFLLGSIQVNASQVQQMFLAAGLLAAVALPFAWLATRHEKRPEAVPGPSLLTLLRRHNPGIVLAVGVAMGVGLGLPGTFLRTYATELGIPRIALFFFVYSAAAILTRVVTRRWPELYGPRPIILVGMAGMIASLMLFLVVQREWQLVIPAIGFGCSHAVLFPSVVAAGSATFPRRNRGLATVLVLATWDLGLLIGSPLAGAVLKYSPRFGLPAYPTMFLTVAGLLTLVGVAYAAFGHRQPRETFVAAGASGQD